MRVLFVNNEDKIGRRFNGYDAAIALRKLGHVARMIVWKNQNNSSDEYVTNINSDDYASRLKESQDAEAVLSWQAIIEPWKLYDLSELYDFDVVHVNIFYPNLVNLFDLLNLSTVKPVVLSLHDFWPMKGHCIILARNRPSKATA